jgi:hypothetical protein
MRQGYYYHRRIDSICASDNDAGYKQISTSAQHAKRNACPPKIDPYYNAFIIGCAHTDRKHADCFNGYFLSTHLLLLVREIV